MHNTNIAHGYSFPRSEKEVHSLHWLRHVPFSRLRKHFADPASYTRLIFGFSRALFIFILIIEASISSSVHLGRNRTTVGRMAVAKEVAGEQLVVYHHLEYGVHVASFAQIKQTPNAFLAALLLREFSVQ